MTRSRSVTGVTQIALLGTVAALLSVATGYGVSRLGDGSVRAAPHWILLALLATGSTAALIWAVRREELMTPIGLTALVVLVYFVVRPLQLSLETDQLLHAPYNVFATPLQSVRDLGAQEITLFTSTRMTGSLDAALTRALAALALFFGVLLIGYRSGVGRRLAVGVSRLGRTMEEIDVSWVVAAWLLVGLGGEAIIFARIGGVGSAVNQLGTQGNLAVSFIYLVILNFYTVGLLLWMCYRTPESASGKLLLGAAVAEFVLFLALLGSRTLVVVPILLLLVAWNELRQPLRLRVLVPAAVLAVLFAAAYLGVREDQHARSLSQVVSAAPRYAVDVATILNSSPVFDQLLEETNYVPASAGYRHGGELAQGILGQVPRFVYPGKPEATDITFRKLIWGDRFLAGRPVGAAGEVYRDFGFPGIAFGGLLVGVLARMLTGLRVRSGPPEGRRFRALLFVVGMLLLYQFLVGSYSLVLGSALEIAIPLLLALGLFARRT